MICDQFLTSIVSEKKLWRSLQRADPSVTLGICPEDCTELKDIPIEHAKVSRQNFYHKHNALRAFILVRVVTWLKMCSVNFTNCSNMEHGQIADEPQNV